MDSEFLALFLPEQLFAHFNITRTVQLGLLSTKSDCLYIGLGRE